MLAAFKKHIETNNLNDFLLKPLLALSGGIDSMVLAHLLIKSNIHFDAAHVNFQLRADESLADEKLVRSFCKQHKIKLHVKQFDTQKISKKWALGIEESARKLRYKWFDELDKKYNYSSICTAHQANDLAETILMNLIRSSGIRGLSGIPIINGKIIRPLLFATRDEIKDYAIKNSIPYNEDSSNASLLYRRNFIRHQIIPSIIQLNPFFIEEMQGFAERMNEINQLIEENPVLKKHSTKIPCEIPYKDITNKTILFEIIRVFGFNKSDLIQLWDCILQKKSAKIFISNDIQIKTGRNSFWIEKKADVKIENPIYIESLPAVFSWKNKEYKIYPTEYKKNSLDKHFVCSLNLNELSFPIEIRSVAIGDRMRVLGMKSGTKKISDIFIDKKVESQDKDNAFVLVSKDKIATLFPFVISEFFKVSSDVCVRIEELKKSGNN